jgi:Zn-dependent M28 family amino/carboxypeptidase
MRRLTSITLLAFMFAASPLASGQGSTDNAAIKSSLEKWVYFLASDAMKGRANGSPEMKTAASYIAGVFSESGLKPGFAGGYISPYTFTSRNLTIDEQNVSAIIPGNDPALKDEYIIITAHFDHVGIGRPVDGDSIYNGADDNAAGTATIMAVAKRIMETGMKPGRTLVFVAFSGEEMGMRGSRHYVANPAVDLKKAYVNLNIEMPGYNRILGKENFYMTGESQTNIDDLIREFEHPTQWRMNSTYANAERLFRASDNVAFTTVEKRGELSAGVPSTTLCTHAGEEHIHRPNDEPQYIDYDNMAGFVNYLTDLVVWMSKSNREIVWTGTTYVRY